MSVSDAATVAYVVHADQEDLGGNGYFGHVQRVAESVSNGDARKVGFLHDTVEDGDVSVSEVREAFGEEVANAVSLLTHSSGESYAEYIGKLSGNELAREVKLADLEDNLDLSRLDDVSADDLDRAVKYGHAHRYLLEKDS